jgi:DNA-binding CsgD family transcriptional regulator
MQEALTNDRRLIVELEQIKIRLSSFSQNQRRDTPVMVRNNVDLSMSAENVLSSLTPTERQILQILADGRAKGAPDLGVRLNKSREHMARLMKKLYFEGYVNRESNRSPFKYTLNDKLRPNLGLAGESINQQASQSV